MGLSFSTALAALLSSCAKMDPQPPTAAAPITPETLWPRPGLVLIGTCLLRLLWPQVMSKYRELRLTSHTPGQQR